MHCIIWNIHMYIAQFISLRHYQWCITLTDMKTLIFRNQFIKLIHLLNGCVRFDHSDKKNSFSVVDLKKTLKWRLWLCKLKQIRKGCDRTMYFTEWGVGVSLGLNCLECIHILENVNIFLNVQPIFLFWWILIANSLYFSITQHHS